MSALVLMPSLVYLIKPRFVVGGGSEKAKFSSAEGSLKPV
jgi:hypothetical protein